MATLMICSSCSLPSRAGEQGAGRVEQVACAVAVHGGDGEEAVAQAQIVKLGRTPGGTSPTRSHLLTHTSTGLPLRRRMSAICMSVAVRPAVMSVTNRMTSALSMATSACSLILDRIISPESGSSPPVSIRDKFAVQPTAVGVQSVARYAGQIVNNGDAMSGQLIEQGGLSRSAGQRSPQSVSPWWPPYASKKKREGNNSRPLVLFYASCFFSTCLPL